MNRRRIILMNGQEDDEMKEWKTLKGVSNYPLTYLRKAGSEYYTKITAEIINGFLDGTISKKGNNELVGFQNLLMNVESIKEISLVTNNLFKTGSKVTVLYR